MYSSEQIKVRNKYLSKINQIDVLIHQLKYSHDGALITGKVKDNLRTHKIGNEYEYSSIFNQHRLIEYLNQLKKNYQQDIAIKLYTGGGINRKRSSRRLNIL